MVVDSEAESAPPPRPQHSAATRLFAGGDKTCVVDEQGQTWCWGGSRFKSLPQGTRGCGTEHQPAPCVREPVPLELPTEVIELDLTPTRGCALLDDGTVWCWGEDHGGALRTAGADPRQCSENYGQIVLHSLHPRPGQPERWFDDQQRRAESYCTPEPTRIRLPKPATGLTGWRMAPCATMTDTLMCWGLVYRYDQLRSAPACAQGHCAPKPTQVRGVTKAVAVGGVAVWSLDPEGRLFSNLRRTEQLAENIREVDIIGEVACGLQGTQVVCWGLSARGHVLGPNAELDDLGNSRAVTPIEVGIEAQQVAVGMGSACALGLEGEVLCWGTESATELGGNGSTAIPRAIKGLPPAVEVAQGWTHACARTKAGEIWCWGDNRSGQVGSHDDTCTYDVVSAGESGDCQRAPVRVWPAL